MEYSLALQLSHATEMAAIGAARAAGYGDKNKADRAAVKAMRTYFNEVDFNGKVVIGEGEKDEAPMLYIGEKLGTGKGKAVDIAVDPLENTSATAKLDARAICVLAASEKGGLFHGPEMYMDKLIVGHEAVGKVHLDETPKNNLKVIAKSLDREVRDLVVVILDRERHEELIAKVRETGARVRLVSGGDLTPGIAACMRGTGVHAVMGIGGAPEGVIAAAAIRCLKGEFQGRFWPKNKEQEDLLKKLKMKRNRIYNQDELAPGKEIIFCATGVTKGDFLDGVRFFGGGARTHTLVMSSQTGKIRFIDTTHVFNKEEIDYML